MLRYDFISLSSFAVGFCFWFSVLIFTRQISFFEKWNSQNIVGNVAEERRYKNCSRLSSCLRQMKLFNPQRQPLEVNKLSIERYCNSKNCPSLQIPIVITLCIEEQKLTSDDLERKRTWRRQAEQIRVMLASLLLFSLSPKWRVICVTDTWKSFFRIAKLASRWPQFQRKRLIFERRQMFLPSHSFLKKWRPCCWGKMFLYEMLPELDFIVYIDTDFLFVGPAEVIWQQINLMDEMQLIAYGPEPWYSHENYSRTIAGKYGINTGIALMNLTRARKLPDGGYGYLLLQEISFAISPRHDQDVANSFLSKHPELLMELSPRFNFHPAICTENIRCEDCSIAGIISLHGSDASFYKYVDSRIQVTYAIFLEFSINFSLTPRRLLALIESQFDLTQSDPSRIEACKNYTDFTNILLFWMKKVAVR